jgi:hypothetical protein
MYENMTVSEVCAVSEVLCSFSESDNCSVSDEKKGDTRSVCTSHIGGNGRHAKEACVSHLSKGKCALWRRVFLLLNMPKMNTYRLFSTGFSLR